MSGLPGIPRDEAFARVVLAQRTRDLARPETAVDAAEADVRPVVVVPIADALYGIALSAARAVIPMRPCAPALGAPRAVMGLFSDNGHLVAAIDLAEALGFAPLGEAAAQGHLIILRGPRPFMALAVARAARVVPAPAQAFTPLPGEAVVAAHLDLPAGLAGPQAATVSMIEPKRLLASLFPSAPRPPTTSGA